MWLIADELRQLEIFQVQDQLLAFVGDMGYDCCNSIQDRKVAKLFLRVEFILVDSREL